MGTLAKPFSVIITMLSQSLKSKCPNLQSLEILRFISLVIVLCMEVYLMMQEWKPIYHLLPPICFLLFLTFIHYLSGPSPVYLVDYSCLRPPKSCRVPISTFIEHATAIDCFDADSVSFMAKILQSSGQSEETCLPPALHCIPPRTHHLDSIQEAEMLLFPVMDDLFSKTHVSPSQIDILIANCSGFCPVPSLCSIVINRYSMRDDIKSFNLSGMGCSAGTLGVHLAENLLKLSKNSYAIILSTEILSNAWYAGKERPKLLINCLFRMGSAAVLLTNDAAAAAASKYKLFKTLRTQRAFDDRAYNSAIREEDSNGSTGVHLNRDLLHVAGETLRANISILGAEILPLTEKLRHALSVIRRKLAGGEKSGEVYVPDFKTAVQHFCLPASGRAVIREIGRGLQLREREMEAAVMTLHRFGNLSSASVWYELAYMEAKERVQKGEKVWQLGMGSGPKCNSVLWECVRSIMGEAQKGPWSDTIDMYPIQSHDH